MSEQDIPARPHLSWFQKLFKYYSWEYKSEYWQDNGREWTLRDRPWWALTKVFLLDFVLPAIVILAAIALFIGSIVWVGSYFDRRECEEKDEVKLADYDWSFFGGCQRIQTDDNVDSHIEVEVTR